MGSMGANVGSMGAVAGLMMRAMVGSMVVGVTAMRLPPAPPVGGEDVNNLSMKKSSIDGNKYLDYLWEHGCSRTTI